jgi:choline dehydrogenase-like flavoprotein
MQKNMKEEAVAMLKIAGLQEVEGYARIRPPGLCIHEMGTARMGHDEKTSVLNKFNQTHDVDNLFVTDGSAMTSNACQNPSLTYMALTARAVDYAVKQMQLGNI